MLLSNASVLSVEDGILTLRFVRDGDLKGFSASGHDATLKRVLSNDFGLNVTIKGVAGADAGSGSAQLWRQPWCWPGRAAGASRRGGRPPARIRPPGFGPGVPGPRSAGFRPAGIRRAIRRAG